MRRINIWTGLGGISLEIREKALWVVAALGSSGSQATAWAGWAAGLAVVWLAGSANQTSFHHVRNW